MSTHHHLATRVNRLFLDYENVVKIDGDVLSREDVFLTIFRGAQQKKMDNEVVDALLANSSRVKIVDVVTAGKNALDFVLAGYVGYSVRANPGDYFHIISKDKGFDALVEQLKREKIRAHRHDRFRGIPNPGKKKPSGSPDSNKLVVPEDHLTGILEHIGKDPSNRPRRKKTLLNYLKSKLGLKATEQEAQKVLNELCSSEKISIGDDNLVTYRI